MADGGAIRAGRAFVELFADDTKLQKGLKGAEGSLKKWGLGIAKVGGAIFGAGATMKAGLDAALVAFEEVGSGLARMSARTGISVETLSRFSFAASQTGVDMETLEGGIRKMQKTLGQASVGSKEAEESLERIGFSVQDLINLSPEDQFKAIADRLMQIENPAQRAAATMGIFGKSGTELLPMLEQGSAGIGRLMEKADELGLTMSGADAEAAEKLHGAMSSVWATLRGLTVAIGGALAPSVTGLFSRIAGGVGTVVKWIKDNRELVVTVSTIATAVIGAGLALVAMGGFIFYAGSALGFISTAASVVAAIVTGAFGAIIAVLGFVLSPIGLVVAAVVGLGVWIATTTGKIQGILDDLSDAFGDVGSDFKQAWDGIKAAVKAGDFQAAIAVLWAFIKLEFARGLAFIEGSWIDLKAALAQVWDVDLFFGLKGAWIDVCAFMSQAWVTMQRGLKVSFGGFQHDFARAWITFTNETIGGVTHAKTQEILAQFEETYARNGNSVVSNGALDKESADIEARRVKDKGENDAAHQEALGKWRLEHAPDLAAGQREKTAAEADAEKRLAGAMNDLEKATKAAHEAEERNGHHHDPHNHEGNKNEADVASKVGAAGTFNSWALALLGGSDNYMKRIAVASEQTANNTHNIAGGMRP